jgi:hypothetical protein
MDERRCGVRNYNVQLGIPSMVLSLVAFLHANIGTPGKISRLTVLMLWYPTLFSLYSVSKLLNFLYFLYLCLCFCPFFLPFFRFICTESVCRGTNASEKELGGGEGNHHRTG